MQVGKRRMWGIGRFQLKRVCKVTFGLFCVFLALLYILNDCSMLAFSPECEPSFLTVKLNTSAIAFDYTSLNHSGIHGTRRGGMVDGKKPKVLGFVNDLDDAFNESAGLRMDPVFEERREAAEKACADLLNSALEAELNTKSRIGAKSPHISFSVGATVSPENRETRSAERRRRALAKMNRRKGMSFYYFNNNITAIGRPRYFQSQMLTFQNRWVHYHRIIKSSRGPKYNKVVEIKWCPVFKAASTPFLAIFTKLSKALTNHTEAAIKKGKMGFLELAKQFRLLTPRRYDRGVHPIRNVMVVVRHPFKRLLSGYKDKIERVKGRLYYYNKYSTKIMQKFRTRKANLTQLERTSRDKDFSLKIPTFQEFVKFILSFQPKKLDEHWRPMFLDCNPCQKRFDFILKVETLDEDMKKILKYLQLEPKDPLYREALDVWKRWNNPSTVSGNKTSHKSDEFYFSQLTKDQMQKLHQLYEPDFRLFGYSPRPYLLMTMDENQNHANRMTNSSPKPA